jgi:hypothetical protein
MLRFFTPVIKVVKDHVRENFWAYAAQAVILTVFEGAPDHHEKTNTDHQEISPSIKK